MTSDGAQALPPLPEPDGEMTISLIGREVTIDGYR